MRARMVGWGPKTHEFFPVGENLYRAIIQPGEKLPVDSRVRLNILTGPGDRIAAEPEAVAIGVVGSGQGFACSGERFDLDLVPPEGDLPRTLIEIKEDSAGVYERFESAAGRILLEPQGEFLYKGLEFRIRDLKGDVGPKHGVYADRDGWPVYLGRFNSAGVAEIRLRRIENLVVLQDTVPPEITSVGRFRRRSDGKATFTARVADQLSEAMRAEQQYVDEQKQRLAFLQRQADEEAARGYRSGLEQEHEGSHGSLERSQGRGNHQGSRDLLPFNRCPGDGC